MAASTNSTTLSYSLAPSGQLSAMEQQCSSNQDYDERPHLPVMTESEDYAGPSPHDAVACFYPTDSQGNQLDKGIPLNQTDCEYLNC